MSRGLSFGGGQSSLGYLFEAYEEIEAEDQKATKPLNAARSDMEQAKSRQEGGIAKRTISDYYQSQGHNLGNYITESSDRKQGKSQQEGNKNEQAISNNYNRTEGHNLRNFITESSDRKQGKSPQEDSKNEKAISKNYNRTEGHNLGNFITGRTSRKVQAAPGGASSLGYLFGDM